MKVAGFAAHHARVIVFGVAFTTLAGVYSLTVLPSGIRTSDDPFPAGFLL